MATFFLCMIYAAFISLGLPDSLLGAAWPAMQPRWAYRWTVRACFQ